MTDEAPKLPAEIMVWHHRPELWWLGSWATTRYPEDAKAYVPKDEFDRVKYAAVLGLQMAKANDLFKTAEHIAKALRIGGEPCGECHLQPGETCAICGAKNATD